MAVASWQRGNVISHLRGFGREFSWLVGCCGSRWRVREIFVDKTWWSWLMRGEVDVKDLLTKLLGVGC